VPVVFHIWSRKARAGCCLVFAAGTLAEGRLEPSVTPALTNVAQLRVAGLSAADASQSIQIEGDVWWADPAANQLVLHDASGTEKLELDLRGRPALAGQRVRVEGNGTIALTANSLRLGVVGPLVDNNGLHAMIEKSGAVYLPAGRQPLRLDWFNDTGKFGLELAYQVPGLPRQKIPDTALFLRQTVGESNRPTNGLEFSAYDVAGEVLPDFSRSAAIKSGLVSNFDLGILPHAEHIGVQFTGEIEVPRAGLYRFFLKSDDGSQLFVGNSSLRVAVIGIGEFPRPRPVALGQTLADDEDLRWATTEGMVTFAAEIATGGLELDVSSATGRIRLQIADRAGLSPPQLLGRRLRATGVCQGAHAADGEKVADTLLVSSAKTLEFVEAAPPVFLKGDTNAPPLPVLTTAAEVHRLKREEAERGYPVKIRGVVTCVLPEHQAFTIQDATRGIYVEDHSTNRAFSTRIGEMLEIDGTTDPSFFAPIVKAQEIRSLGAGLLPERARPTWDQLLNGSLDAQYVELQGIITAVNANIVMLLTRDGRIRLELRLAGPETESLARYEDALVRVRGCLLAKWDYATHEVKVGEIRVYDATISVDQPAPEDLFAIPGKTVAELLLFDPQASVFQRVKVSGQIVHVRGAEGFLSDGRSALRFVAKKPADLQAGDLVDVAGFAELSGTAPVLREAVVRRTGHVPLPRGKVLPVDDVARAGCDATLVRVKGVLVSVRKTSAEWVLEIQNGVRTFAARLNSTADSVGSLPVGSLLELTGVYSSLGANKAAGQNISAFELLLNSAADIQVLARPPWWTLERLLIIVGALACGLAVTVLWITQLHRKVEQRTAELAAQIQKRQQVEQQRAMEQERARVAQDLHDELGSSLTEISMLGARARSPAATDEKRESYLEQIAGKSREMVTALDEIVWAMNPRHDSLASLVSYFCLYADRFLGLANIVWRLEGDSVPPDFVVDSRHRHQLFLAFKEALTNVVRHSGATEVRLGIWLEAGELWLSMTDNGHGLPTETRTEAMDGVANMRARLEKLGGRFEITSAKDCGTTLRFCVPAKLNL
jgi:signal transduction histidine kinase